VRTAGRLLCAAALVALSACVVESPPKPEDYRPQAMPGVVVPENWVAGSPLDWMEAVVDPSTERLSCGGDPELAGALIEGLHESLFGTKEESPLSR